MTYYNKVPFTWLKQKKRRRRRRMICLKFIAIMKLKKYKLGKCDD